VRPAGLRAAVGGHLAQPLYRTAYSLMAATVLTSVLGVGFWVVAARLYPPEVVGRDGALIASMMALSTIAQLNLLTAIDRFLPRMGAKTARTVAAAYALSGTAALVLGVGFVLVVPHFVHDLRAFRTSVPLAAVFVFAMVSWGVFVIQDAALTAVRAAPWIPLENAVFGVLKIAALPVTMGLVASHGIFASWLLPVLIVIPPVNWFLFRRAIPRHVAGQGDGPRSIDEFTRRGLTTFLARDYLSAVFSQGAFMLLPLLVVALLGSRENAYFSVAVTLVTSFDLLAWNAVTSFTVEGTLTSDRRAELTRAVVRRLLAPLAGASIVLVALAPVVLLPFGADYAREATPLVRLLACASLFRAAQFLYGALCRLDGRAWPLVMLGAGQFILLLPLTLLLVPIAGLKGAALAWLVTHAILAVPAMPAIASALRGPAPAPSAVPEAELPEAELPEAELSEAELSDAELPESELPLRPVGGDGRAMAGDARGRPAIAVGHGATGVAAGEGGGVGPRARP
jgi:O-antigen/teichoic acid export membrane protein